MVEDGKSLGFTYMDRILDYFAIEVVTDYENNIKQHFVEHLLHFLNVFYNKKEIMATGSEVEKKKLFADIKAAKNFLLIQE